MAAVLLFITKTFSLRRHVARKDNLPDTTQPYALDIIKVQSDKQKYTLKFELYLLRHFLS